MHFQSGLAKCCLQPQPECVIEEIFVQIGVSHASVSLPVLTTVQEQIRSTVASCCSAADSTVCLKEKESKLEKTAALLSKTDTFCLQRFKLELPLFKTMVQQEVQRDGTESQGQAWVKLAIACCSQHSPAQLCQKLTEAVIKHEDEATA